MEECIKFRLLSNKLSDKECACKLFLINLIEMNGTEFFLSALFTYFINHHNDISKTINCLENIIESKMNENNDSDSSS